MTSLQASTFGVASLLTSGLAQAQGGHMMDGGWWGAGSMGGYGGIWMPILVVAVVVGIVLLIVKRK
jgi:uncharacterized membrane protein